MLINYANFEWKVIRYEQYKDRWRVEFSSLDIVFKYPKNINPKLKCLVFGTDLVIIQFYSAGKFAWNLL